jgi:uncharacterized short protein YbdD (DUF466 family)
VTGRAARLRRGLRGAWALLRQWSGDDAYERYVAHHQLAHPDQRLLSRREFVRRYQHERFSSGPNRCC